MNINGNFPTFDVMEKELKFKKEYEQKHENEYESKLYDYGKID